MGDVGGRAGGLAALPLRRLLRLGVGRDFWHTRAEPSLGVPSLTLADGPAGLRRVPEGADGRTLGVSEPATCHPAPATLACSWDPDLARRVGRALGEEARSQGVDVVLGPSVNLKRSPLCGRDFEYLSEDPLLAGVLGAAWTEGLQSAGVAACVKHLAANSRERDRFVSDSVVDERTLRELYLAPFERVVREARPACVMSAYNLLNGTYCSESAWLLRDVLRGEWGFSGCVVTDWGAMRDRAAGYRAGCDLAMPGPAAHHVRSAARAVREGRLERGAMEESASRVAALARGWGHAGERVPAGGADVARWRAVAREAALAGQVLLANDGVLPIAADARVALVGPWALSPRIQGAGSAQVEPRRVATLAGAAPGWELAAGCRADGTTDEALLAGARAAASRADVAVVVLGLPAACESEGFDRDDLRLPEGCDRLVRAVAATGTPCVVVLQTGGPVELPWADEVSAILWSGLAGEAGAEACLDVLEGRADAAGRLAETWPASLDDVPCAEDWREGGTDARYREGLLVGYRHCASAGVRPRFPFGHGLSYARFSYADLEAGEAEASFAVANGSGRAGVEVCQVYVAPPEGGPYRPRLRLAGFARVGLAAGESRRVRVALDPRAFQAWDGSWRRIGGTYRVLVARSSEDVRLEAAVEVAGEWPEAPAWQRGSWYERPCGQPPEEGFARVPGVGRAGGARGERTYDERSSLLELSRDSRLARLVTRVVRWGVGRDYRDHEDGEASRALGLYSSVSVPLFVLANNSSGLFPCWLARLLVACARRGARRQARRGRRDA